MDSDYINENQVADRYLMGQLTPEESAEFEERLLWDKEVQDELILCQKLRQGIKDAETARVSCSRSSDREAPETRRKERDSSAARLGTASRGPRRNGPRDVG